MARNVALFEGLSRWYCGCAGETVRMHRVAWAFVFRPWDKYSGWLVSDKKQLKWRYYHEQFAIMSSSSQNMRPQWQLLIDKTINVELFLAFGTIPDTWWLLFAQTTTYIVYNKNIRILSGVLRLFLPHTGNISMQSLPEHSCNYILTKGPWATFAHLSKQLWKL